MPNCVNYENEQYTGDENTPLGLGYSPTPYENNTHAYGKDGQMYNVYTVNGTKTWTLNEQFVKFTEVETLMKQMMENSYAVFDAYQPLSDRISKMFEAHKYDYDECDIFDASPLSAIVTLKYTFDDDATEPSNDPRLVFTKKFGWTEFNRIAYESEFFKYITNSGHDTGFNKHRCATESSTFYSFSLNEWTEYESQKNKFYNSNEYHEMMNEKNQLLLNA